jgi:hypothetical protein
VAHPVHVSTLSGRVSLYSPGYGFPLPFGAATFASWTVPVPAGDSAACDWPTIVGPHRVATFRTGEMRSGGCPLYPGPVVSAHAARGDGVPAQCRRLDYPSFRRLPLTKPHRDSHVHPSDLALTLVWPDGSAFLRRYPQLRTSPLPATHMEAGTSGGYSLGARTASLTHTVRLRVAPTTWDYIFTARQLELVC